MNIKAEFEESYKKIERAKNFYHAQGDGVMAVYLSGVLTGIKYAFYPLDHDMKSGDLDKITKDIINKQIK